MNRIILIGNGFDLAHGLPTSYKNFIDWYWEEWKKKLVSCIQNVAKDELCEFSLCKNGSVWLSFLSNNVSRINPPKGKELVEYLKQLPYVKVKYSNFLEEICKSVETKGWIDIENEYYRLLLSCLDSEKDELDHQTLNKQLNYLQTLLVEYLKALPIDKVDTKSKIREIIYSPINPNDISVSEKEQIISHMKYWIDCDPIDFDDKMRKYKISGMESYDQLDYKTRKENIDLEYMVRNYSTFFLPDNILILNFNYTDTAKKYIKEHQSVVEINHIHGELSKPESIIFGYGDELDENYKKISNLNDNEYLTNFKSIKYLESDRYRRALQFMDAAPYQVFIMGHSCGNSDRTLLNTLFEHKNCVSIKPYYYKDGNKDNYLEIVQNISRNFKDMKLMRDRVVNKTYCEPFSERVS